MIVELSLFLSLTVLALWTFSNTIIKKVSVSLGTYRTSSIVVGFGIFPMIIAILVESLFSTIPVSSFFPLPQV